MAVPSDDRRFAAERAVIDPARWERIKQLFEDAVARQPDQRAAYLLDACGSDRELRAELESLLAAHDRAGRFAANPADEILNELDSGSIDAARRLLHAGERLGVYEIEEFVGAGGMGDVYKARDTRLDRVVAIKVLPPHVAGDPDRFHRFEREARAVASLDHPHIGALYDVGQHGEVRFLVMQYLDGETLAVRLARGRLPIEQLLRYAVELAEALDHAHRRGIVHRDLKPANVFLTKSGVKLIDFGLAAWRVGAMRWSAGVVAAPDSAAGGLTKAGALLGTLRYMAPEQLIGRNADVRSDLFAFGAVVYEMAAGARPFGGESTAALIAAIVHVRPPSLATVQPHAPAALARLVDACLAKDPDDRWQSAADVARELRWIGAGDPQQLDTTSQRSAVARRPAASLWPLGGLLVGAAVAAVAWNVAASRTSARVLPVTRSIVPTPAVHHPVHQGFAISSDGTHLAYVAENKLYLRALDELEWKRIAAADGASAATFSPDGRWIAFFAKGALKKVGIGGGAAQEICRASESFGIAWGPDDTIVFTDSHNAGLSRVSASGGTPTPLTTIDAAKKEKSHRYPQFLPGGHVVLFTIVSADMTTFDDARIAAVSLQTGRQKILVAGGLTPAFSPTGHLIYARGGALFAAPFDVDRLAITGDAVPVVDGVSTSDGNGYAEFAFAATGLLAYVRGGMRRGDRRVMSVDRHGRAEPLVDTPQNYLSVYVSPNGRQLALTTTSATDRMWLYDLERRTLTPLTSSWDNRVAGWTPDGTHITFSSDRAGPYNFYWQRPDAGDAAERLTAAAHQQGDDGTWSPDGQFFVFHDQANPSADLSMLTMRAGRTVRPLIATPFSELDPRFSPDGRWLAYDSDDSGREEVYVQSFPDLRAKIQISTGGGIVPVWNPRGHELFYWNEPNQAMIAVPIETAPRLAAGTPRVLFKGDYTMWNYDVMPDGQRFVMIEGVASDVAGEIALVHNWFEELKARAPKNGAPPAIRTPAAVQR